MPAPNVLEINPGRLWETLERSAEIGRFRDVGLRRLALSAEDKQMRDLFVDWAKKAGCTVEIDRLGNIFARRAGSDASLPPVAIGSHLDTQICGGRYDGILGVLCGLEVVRTLNDRGLATKRGIEVICWTNEEGGRFAPPMMGSMAFAGVLPLKDVLATRDDDGITVEKALDAIGYAGPAPLGKRKFDAYLELHIEQAPVLDRDKIDVGIVVGGYKTRALRLTIRGDTGHAGGTPMAMRKNALVGAGYVIAAVNDVGLAYAADEGRTTTTRIESFPNLPGTYAEEVKLTLDYRHIDQARFEAMGKAIEKAIAESARKANVEIDVAQGWSWGSELFAPECIELLKSTAKELGLPYREMRSQAGHDAYAVATMAPTAMIFTPCFEGISHNVKENIELTRSVPGANLLLNAAVARANR
jgi:beta-ureidopropionase / N-carbamoyl-L-amino-acid hydrolase